MPEEFKRPPVRAGDLIAVRYYHGDLIQEGIAKFQKKKWVHILWSLGDFGIIEANTGGVRWTDLRDYLIRGNCDLLVLRPRRMKIGMASLAVAYWKGCVKKNDGYSFLGDARLGLILLGRNLGLGRLAKYLPDNLLLSAHEKFCSQGGIKGLQEAGAISSHVDSFDWWPSRIAADTANFEHVALWIGHHGRWME